jgi:hypothetical protein
VTDWDAAPACGQELGVPVAAHRALLLEAAVETVRYQSTARDFTPSTPTRR